MKIFLSYAAEDRELADQVQLALAGGGHQVFFDRASLPASGDYHARIRAAVERSDLFVFLISPDSVAPGSYALTELKYARTRWPHPKGRLLPVRVRATPWKTIPGYAKAVTILEPEGNIPAEVLAAVYELEREAAQAGASQVERLQDDAERISPGRAKAHRIAAPLLLAVVVTSGAVGAAIIYWEKLFPSGSPEPAATRDPSSDRRVEREREPVEIPLDRRALAITMIHETGKPRSYTAVYTFNEDLAYGQGLVSLRQGSLRELLQAYIETQDARFATQLNAYLPRVQQMDPELLEDERFKALLARAAGEDPIMGKLQDARIEQGYFGPAREECADIGIKTRLGFALIADTFFHSGRARYERIKLATIRALDGTPATGINEQRWLKRFAEERSSSSQPSIAALVKRRTQIYLDLMKDGKWDLAAPVVVGNYLLVDP